MWICIDNQEVVEYAHTQNELVAKLTSSRQYRPNSYMIQVTPDESMTSIDNIALPYMHIHLPA